MYDVPVQKITVMIRHVRCVLDVYVVHELVNTQAIENREVNVYSDKRRGSPYVVLSILRNILRQRDRMSHRRMIPLSSTPCAAVF